MPLSLVILTLLITSILSFYQLQQHHIKDEVQLRIDGVQQMFQLELSEDAELLDNIIELVEYDKDLQNIWLAKDRDALLDYAIPLFKTLHLNKRITHFHFHGLDKTCFLRVHKPQRYGDPINRFTLDEAARQKKPVQGIELGPLGTFTLRVVHPWQINGQVTGYIELGHDIEHIISELKKILGVELLVIIHKSHLDRAGWEEGLEMMGRAGNWGQFANFVINGSTIKQTKYKRK